MAVLNLKSSAESSTVSIMTSVNTASHAVVLRSEAQTVLTVDLAIRAANAAKQIDVAFDLAVRAALQIVDKIPGHEPFGPELQRIQVVSPTVRSE